MLLNLKVHGLSFEVPCGDGEQTFKWVGLVAAQRYALMIPSGRSRTREDAHAKVGFYIPAQVLHKDKIMHPGNRIIDHCQDGDTLEVSLQHEMGVDASGGPTLTSWSASAFIHTDEMKARLLAHPETEKGIAELDNNKDEDWNVEKEMLERTKDFKFREAMTGQAETPTEIEATVDFDWGKIELEQIEADEKEQVNLRDIVVDHFLTLNAIYRHYGVGAPGDSYRMSFLEFTHFMHESRMFDSTEHAALLRKLFVAANGSKNSKSPDAQDAPLQRYQFLETLIRAAVVRDNIFGDGEMKVSEAFSKAISVNYEAGMMNITTGPIRDITNSNAVLALFHEYRAKMGQIYAPSSDPNDVMTASRFSDLIRDSGILCKIDPEEHSTYIYEAISDSFSGFSEKADRSQQQLCFVEFLEAISRLVLQAWEGSDISPKEIIALGFEAIRSGAKASTT